MFKNRKVLIIVGVVVAVVLLVVVYFFFAGKSKSKSQEDTGVVEQAAETLAPDKIGLTMEANSSRKAVGFAIAKADGITSIEYQVIYEANSTAQEQSEGGEPRVQRGITGDAAIKAGQSSFQSEWLDLGSCSKNVCRYDSGVKSVTLTLKIVKEDGKVYQVEKTLEL